MVANGMTLSLSLIKYIYPGPSMYTLSVNCSYLNNQIKTVLINQSINAEICIYCLTDYLKIKQGRRQNIFGDGRRQEPGERGGLL